MITNQPPPPPLFGQLSLLSVVHLFIGVELILLMFFGTKL